MSSWCSFRSQSATTGRSQGTLTTGNVSSWAWDFGDGTTSTLQNPSHTFGAAGTYSVTLTSTGPGGFDAEAKPGYIVVSMLDNFVFNSIQWWTGDNPVDPPEASGPSEFGL